MSFTKATKVACVVEPIEQRILLAGVTDLSFRAGNLAASPIVTSATAGQAIYLHVDTDAAAGQKVNVQVWEDDGLASRDDKVDTVEVTIGSQGFGTALWTPSWQGDDTDAPQNQYYLLADPAVRSATNLNVSVPSPSANQIVSPVTYDWGQDPGSDSPIAVTLTRFGSSDKIDPAKRTWLVIHGRSSNFDPSTAANPNYMWDLAQAIKNAQPADQILTLDWRDGAAGTSLDFSGEAWIKPVAQWAAKVLRDEGFSTPLLNLVGHSWGAVMTSEIASAFAGGVNDIVALDPARDATPFGTAYDTGTANFSAQSNYAWAFHSPAPYIFNIIPGDDKTPATADQSFVVQDSSHSGVVELFISMLKNPTGGVSHWFTLNKLLSAAPGPWKTDQYNESGAPAGQYEAIIDATSGGSAPLRIDYLDSNSGQPKFSLEADQVNIPGDSNGDGRVDFVDLVAVAQNYGGTGKTRAQGDFDGDGKTDFADLVAVAQNYGIAASSPVSASAVAVRVKSVTQSTAKKPAPAQAPRPAAIFASRRIVLRAANRH